MLYNLNHKTCYIYILLLMYSSVYTNKYNTLYKNETNVT